MKFRFHGDQDWNSKRQNPAVDAFKQLEKPREAQNNYQTNWPTDEQPASRKPVELAVEFKVTAVK